MSVPQGILIGVVVLIALVGFIEATAVAGFRITAPRITLALLSPSFCVALILFFPTGVWFTIVKMLDSWFPLLRFVILIPLLLLFFITVPLFFIFPIVVWIQGAMCGELKTALKEYIATIRPPRYS